MNIPDVVHNYNDPATGKRHEWIVKQAASVDANGDGVLEPVVELLSREYDSAGVHLGNHTSRIYARDFAKLGRIFGIAAE